MHFPKDLRAVSYTHLDVYKRQAVIRVPYLQLKTPHSEMNLTAQTYWKLVDIPTTGQSVSYTHLDVYKRQVAYCGAAYFLRKQCRSIIL